MAFLDFLFGSKDKKVPVYDQSQNQLLQFIMQMAQQGPQSNPTFQGADKWLQDLFSNDPQSIAAMEGPARQYFEQEYVPGIAERFAGMGSGNQSSSAFRNALANSGKDFATGLSAMRANTQMSALPQALNFAQAPFNVANALGQTALSRPNQQIQQGNPGFLAPILGSFASSFATGGGSGIADLIMKAISGSSKPKASTGLSN